MSINIRKAERSDVKIISDLIYELAVYEKLEHEFVASLEDLERTIFDENYVEVLIGEWDGKAVAYALYFHTYSTFLAKPGIYLEDLFVIEEFRGKGIGKALLKHIAKIAVDNNFGRVEWSVLNWNEPAIDFYKSIGAFPQEEWTMYRLTGDKLKEFGENQ